MSIFRDYSFGYNKTDEQRKQEELELRRRINQNLMNIRSGKYRREADAKAKEKRTELQKAFAWEIQLGHDVLERKELSKHLNRLLRRKNMTEEELGAAEEYQAMIDRYNESLEGYTEPELRRFVRLWNKSQRQKYKL